MFLEIIIVKAVVILRPIGGGILRLFNEISLKGSGIVRGVQNQQFKAFK